MQHIRKTVEATMILLAAVIAASTFSLAQVNSHNGQVILIARMPETVGATLNFTSFAPSNAALNKVERLDLATGVTTSWNLEQGRSYVATSAYIDRRNVPVQIALATGMDVDPFTGPSGLPHFPYGFALCPTVSSTELHAVTIAPSSRVATRTSDLSDSTGMVQPFSQDDYTGSIKIKLQAIP